MANDYRNRFVTPETAAKAVRSGDWVDYGFGAGFPELMDKALAKRKDELKDVEKKLEEQRNQKNNILNEYAAGNKVVHQLIDLALLQNGMLKGEALTNFVKRSIEMI